MAAQDHVDLIISLAAGASPRAGYGVPIILSGQELLSWPERVRYYSSPTEVAADFPLTSSPEVARAERIFSQRPHIRKVGIARLANRPEVKYKITPLAIDNFEYKFDVVCEGALPTTVSYTSDATATVAEIVTGIVAALESVTPNNYLAVDSVTHVDVNTSAVAGRWYSIRMHGDPDVVGSIEQVTTDAGVAADLNVIEQEDGSWYVLHSLYGSEDIIKAIAAWTASRRKLAILQSQDSAILTVAVGAAGDVADDLATLGHKNTALVYDASYASALAEGWAGHVLTKQPGAATWKYKTVDGVAPLFPSLTSTQRGRMIGKNVNFLEESSTNFMIEGTAVDGGFIDNAIALDWLHNAMQLAVLDALIGADKISFDSSGLSVLKGVILGILREAVQRGIFTPDVPPTVQMPDPADITDSHRQTRTLPDIIFYARLAGAVHRISPFTGIITR